MNAPLETHLLETFVEVVRQGSVTEAADELNRSQPAISHRLNTLEERFEVPLLERIGRQLELTEYGERLFERSLEILDRIEGLHDQVVGGPARIEGTVTIGTFPTVARHLMPEAIAEILDEHDRLKLVFRFAPASDLLEALRTGRVDMVIFVGEVDPVRLATTELGSTRLVAAMSPCEAPEPPLSLSDLQHLRFLSWTGPPDPTFDAAYRYAARHDLFTAQTPEIPQIETLRALAAEGLGFTILPHYTTLRDVEAGRLSTFALPQFDQTIPISLLRRDRRIEGPGLRRVRDAVVESARAVMDEP